MNRKNEQFLKTRAEIFPSDLILDECQLLFTEEIHAMPCPAYNSCDCDHISCSVFMG